MHQSFHLKKLTTTIKITVKNAHSIYYDDILPVLKGGKYDGQLLLTDNINEDGIIYSYKKTY